MDQGFSVVIYPVSDLAQAKTFYRRLLGVEPYVDEAYYVGFRVGDQEIGLDPHGHRKGMTGPMGYWQVNDIQTSLRQLLDAGAQVQQEVQDGPSKSSQSRFLAWIRVQDLSDRKMVSLSRGWLRSSSKG